MTKVLTEKKGTESPLACLTARESEKKRVLFVCTGNTCRSPMCAAAVNGLSPYKERFFAFSAGLAPLPGTPISAKAVKALEDAGIRADADNDYPAHRARAVREEDLAACDLAVGLTKAHAFRLAMEFPAYAGKIFAFPEDIPDPYGGEEARYRACLAEILRQLPALTDDPEEDSPEGDAPEADAPKDPPEDSPDGTPHGGSSPDGGTA